MVGVAYRGQIPLEDIAIQFEVAAASAEGRPRSGVRKTITVTGPLGEEHLVRLRRAADFCPVGQYFTKRVTTIEDHVELASIGSPVDGHEAPDPSMIENGLGQEVVLPPGPVRGRYLRDTREWGEESGRRILTQEGEVNVYLACEGLKRPHRWALLGGHTSESWGPRPADFASGALAASTALRRLVAPMRLAHEDLTVVIESAGHRGTGRADVQAAGPPGRDLRGPQVRSDVSVRS